MILDLSAGNRAIWFDKTRDDVVFVDCRVCVRPSVVADSEKLPFSDGIFDLVVFDPPHANTGKNSNMSRSYGWRTTSKIRKLIILTAAEAHRVSKPSALMAFKWNDHDQPLGPVLSLFVGWEALFGHSVALKMMRPSETFWSMLRRLP